MKVEVQQEDLELLATILQEHLRAEVLSGEVFRVKCAVKNDQLMILIEHPLSVTTHTQQVFAVLEEALESLPGCRNQQVEIFIRIASEKLPYAKHSMMVRVGEEGEEGGQGEEGEEGEEGGQGGEISPLPYITYSEFTEEEEFEPIADAPDLFYGTTLKRSLSIKSILVAALSGIALLGIGAYFLTRPCVMSVCKEIQTAAELEKSSQQLTRNARSEEELAKLHTQFEIASTNLKNIPGWSSRHQEAEQLSVNLSGQSEKIKLVLKALQSASLAELKTESPVNSIQQLHNKQQLWREAIAPLEGINPQNELYRLVQRKLSLYRLRLQAVNQQLLNEEKWTKKLADSKSVAKVAATWETKAKSLKDLQRVQSTWQIVVNALRIIPHTSPEYEQAQNLLVDYKAKLATARDRATFELLAAKSYQQAINTANQAKAYEQQNQWQAARANWSLALNTLKQIKADSFYYSQGQLLIEPYANAFNQAEQQAQIALYLQQTRTDLAKTCSSQIRICIFSVDNKGITVKITAEYQRTLQNSLANANPQDPSSFAGISNHLQVLQEALSAISENANLPLIVYDAQGQVVHTRSHEG
ncbi:phage tail tape measure protein [Scytonema hofmannii FACHB-248]|uniref:Phage tail tape measure protein n=1 Tax=Scytonema hofmannii FACHB-248 TaxID=1842502 RepID=A0ABR8GL38_9CYAN|nr:MULTISPECIES: phage tail tape measure protein [Nostocales]MBD2603899.1 phage tail tape measure protein [Scytonema hofmannii FACHB-248]